MSATQGSSARRRPLRRGLRIARTVLALFVVASFLDVGPVRAQEETAPTLAGYQGSAAASGLHAFYNLEGVLPIPPPVDLGAPDALATIASGPATFARAGVVDPGDLLANPDALLALFSSDYPAGTLPPFPYRITASSGVGAPTAESTPAPGLNARVSADVQGSTARAQMPAADAPAIATVGTVSALATTTTDGSSVTVRARSQTAGFNLLGLLSIDSIVTDVSATSDGGEVELSGGTKIVGAELLGMPVTIDTKGIHVAPGQAPLLDGVLGTLTGGLDDVLNQIGIKVTVAGPAEIAGGKTGQLAAAGLKVEFELSRTTFPALAALLDAIPPIENPLPGLPSIEDLLVVAQARHLLSIEVGRGVVSLAATAVGGDLGPVGPDAPIDLGGGFDGSTSDPGDLGFPSVVTPSRPSSPEAPTPASEERELPAGAGVGGLVLLALLAAPFFGERVAWVASAILAANGPDCAWEER